MRTQLNLMHQSAMAIFLLGAASLCACDDDGDGETGDQDQNGIEQGGVFRVASVPGTDVNAYQINVEAVDCHDQSPLDGSALQSWTVPVAGPTPSGGGVVDDPFAPGATHLMSQWTAPLEQGCYRAFAFPMVDHSDHGIPSNRCLPTDPVPFSVLASQITEVVMISNCPQIGDGGGDFAVLANHAPTAELHALSTAVDRCEPLQICVDAHDRDNNELEFVWDGLAVVDAQPQSPTVVDGTWTACVDATPLVAGQPSVRVSVYDLLADGTRVENHPSVIGQSRASLSIPLHVNEAVGTCAVQPQPAGATLWDWSAFQRSVGVAIAGDGQGAMYVCGDAPDKESAIVAKLSADSGLLHWTKLIGSENPGLRSFCGDIEVDTSGIVHTLVRSFGPAGEATLLARLSPAGQLIDLVPAALRDGHFARHLTVAPSGDLFLGGDAGGVGVWAAQYLGDGSEAWYHNQADDQVHINGLDVDGLGNLVLLSSGWPHAGGTLVRLDRLAPGSTTPLSALEIVEPGFTARALDVAHDGAIFIGGFAVVHSPEGPSTLESVVSKYPADGTAPAIWSYRIPGIAHAPANSEVPEAVDLSHNALVALGDGSVIFGGFAHHPSGPRGGLVSLDAFGVETQRQYLDYAPPRGMVAPAPGVLGIVPDLDPHHGAMVMRAVGISTLDLP